MTLVTPTTRKADVTMAGDEVGAQAARRPPKEKTGGLTDVLEMIAAMPEG